MSAGHIPRRRDLFTHWESLGRTDGQTDGRGAPTLLLPQDARQGPSDEGGHPTPTCWDSPMQDFVREWCLLHLLSILLLVFFFIIIFYFSKRVSEKIFNGDGIISLPSFLETCRLVWDKPCSGEKENLSRLSLPCRPYRRDSPSPPLTLCLLGGHLPMKKDGDDGRRAEGFKSALLLPVNT